MAARPAGVRIVEPPVKLYQLVGDYDRERKTQTVNQTATRWKLQGTDLGASVIHNGKLYFLFGDTVGPPGGDAIAWTEDRDPEKPLRLTFPSFDGAYVPLRIPKIAQGDFEVPVAGVSVGGKLYVYHTTDHTPVRTMGRSVLAMSKDGGPAFTYLYDLSTRHFINVAPVRAAARDWPGLPVARGEALLLFGSGDFRRSNVRLAVQPLRDIEKKSTLRYFAGAAPDGSPRWSAAEADSVPLFRHPCVGELSVSWNRYLRKWIMLYNGAPPRGILLRTADRPWGPWSDPLVLFEPHRHGYGAFMHIADGLGPSDGLSDPGRAHEWGGEYGPYEIAGSARGSKGRTTLYFVLSTWNPYTVVVMRTTLEVEPAASPSRSDRP